MYLCKNYNAMKRIHLTKEEKQLLWRIQARKKDCPDNMAFSTYVYTMILLDEKDLIKIPLSRLRDSTLTERGHLYMKLNPQLRNPFPWKVISGISAIIAAIAATAALFVGCVRLLHM